MKILEIEHREISRNGEQAMKKQQTNKTSQAEETWIFLNIHHLLKNLPSLWHTVNKIQKFEDKEKILSAS